MGDLVVSFRVQVWEYADDAIGKLTQTIDADISYFDDEADGELAPIGNLQAHLFHISGMVNGGYAFFDFYDCESTHLVDALDVLYDDEVSRFKEEMLLKVGFEIEEDIDWHLNVTSMDIAPEHRGVRCGVRALRLLRQYTARSGLIVTAKSHPDPRDAPRKPKRAEVKKLRDYYLSEPALGFKRIGNPADGWLVANWSTY